MRPSLLSFSPPLLISLIPSFRVPFFTPMCPPSPPPPHRARAAAGQAPPLCSTLYPRCTPLPPPISPIAAPAGAPRHPFALSKSQKARGACLRGGCALCVRVLAGRLLLARAVFVAQACGRTLRPPRPQPQPEASLSAPSPPAVSRALLGGLFLRPPRGAFAARRWARAVAKGPKRFDWEEHPPARLPLVTHCPPPFMNLWIFLCLATMFRERLTHTHTHTHTHMRTPFHHPNHHKCSHFQRETLALLPPAAAAAAAGESN